MKIVGNRAKRCDYHNLALSWWGGRVVRNTRANVMSIAILSREDCTRVLWKSLKRLPWYCSRRALLAQTVVWGASLRVDHDLSAANLQPASTMSPEKDGSSAWWVDDGVSLGACSSHDVSAPFSQQIRDVDYSYQMRSNTVLSQLRLTVVAGHSGALVGWSGSGMHSSEEGSLDLCMRHHHGGWRHDWCSV